MVSAKAISPSVVILILAHRYGEEGIIGRTRIQKLIYFLKEKLPISVSYVPYYYGPYSEEVTAVLDSLVARGLLCEEVKKLDIEGPFEGRVYRYRLTDDGKAVLQSLRQEHKKEIEKIARRLEEILEDEPSTATLAIASKLHYILKERKSPIPQEKLSELAKKFGWHIRSRDVDEGVRFLVNRGYVQVQ